MSGISESDDKLLKTWLKRALCCGCTCVILSVVIALAVIAL